MCLNVACGRPRVHTVANANISGHLNTERGGEADNLIIQFVDTEDVGDCWKDTALCRAEQSAEKVIASPSVRKFVQ
jgi:hypothetical protein